MPTPRVREIRPDEYAEVGRLLVAAYDAAGRFNDEYRDFLADPSQWVPGVSGALVAVDGDGRPIGCVACTRPGDEEFEPGVPAAGDAGFRFLAVDPDAQGSGAGQALVQACIDRARREGARRLVIHSMAFMTTAHRLYERMGFVRRPDLDVVFPAGRGYTLTLDVVPNAADHFPPPGPEPDEVPWFEDAWGMPHEHERTPMC